MSEFHKVEKMSQVSLGSYKLVGSSAGWAGLGWAGLVPAFSLVPTW